MQDITSLYPPIDLQLLLDNVHNVLKVYNFTAKAFDGWSSIPLRSFRGELGVQASSGTGMSASSDPNNFKDTELMQPYIKEIISHISDQVLKVRLMKLNAHCHIPLHQDFFKKDTSNQVTRIHIPVQTNPDVMFTVNDEIMHLKEARIYIVDVSQKHGVENNGDGDRIHLVFDVIIQKK